MDTVLNIVEVVPPGPPLNEAASIASFSSLMNCCPDISNVKLAIPYSELIVIC
jgi:hypothetical protein